MKLDKKERSQPNFKQLLRGYLGFLTGRGKSLSTISSYKTDLSLLEDFLIEKKRSLSSLRAKDFEAYTYWMERKGLRMNTRRRKILSAKALVRYAVSRRKISASNVTFVKTPERLERLPWIPTKEEYEKILAIIEDKTTLGFRNRLVVCLLAETALTVAELCSLRWEQVQGNTIALLGKKPRKITLTSVAAAMLQTWKQLLKKEGKKESKYLFPGFNRHGIYSEKMTPRGVELFFKNLSQKTSFKDLKPKTLRHYAISQWLLTKPEKEVQERLGVHPNYSFDAYKKFLQL